MLEELREDRTGALDHAFRCCFDEALEVCIPAVYPEGAQIFRGRPGLQRWVDLTKEIWGEWRFEPEQLLPAGDRVVALVRVVARGGSSGVPLDWETAHLWTFRERRVLRCEVYLDRSEALEAVGLQSNVVVVRRIYDAWNEGATAALADLFDEQVELRLNVMMGPYSGHDGVRRFAADLEADWSRLSMTVEEAVGAGDQVVVAVREEGIGRSSQVPITSTENHVWTMRDCRAYRAVAYPNRAKALAAAGLEPR